MISIIVPVYNGEKYLRKTIELLLSQPYKNIELILVNDGSTDSSREICEEYRNNDGRVKLINKQNEGISAARNTGLDKAHGDLISFVDQDDEIDISIYELLSEAIKSFDFAVAGKQMQLINENSDVVSCVDYNFEEKIIHKNEIIDLCFNTDRKSIALHLWNCLFKKSIIDSSKIRFNTNLRFGHEDTLFNIQYLQRCKKVHVVPGIVYRYFRRVSVSTSLKKNELYLNDFNHYVDVVVNNTAERRVDKDILYTYFLRLGVSLYNQYSTSKKDLCSICEICKHYVPGGTVSYRGLRDYKALAFYKMMQWLFDLKLYYIADLIIKRIK